jgi:rod shape determining protein RodA
MWQFLIPSFLLYAFGLFNLIGIKKYLVTNQIIFFVAGLIAFFLIRTIGTRYFRVNIRPVYIVFILLLILVLIFGENINGSKRWIKILFFNFQPSEFFKIFSMVIIADFLAKNQRILNNLSTFLMILAAAAIPAAFIYKQPDLETAASTFLVIVLVCAFSEMPKRYILTLFAVMAAIIPLSWRFIHTYQKNRILSFINPSIDPSGIAYNMTQAIITIGSGQLFGRGLGLGKQSTLFFLPENHTDFAFASLVEQFGFIGGLTIIILNLFIAIMIIRKIVHHYGKRGDHDRFAYFYSIGFLMYFLIQVFVNIGMNLGVLPVSGTALPLISYGGSSLVTWMIGLAFLSEQS